MRAIEEFNYKSELGNERYSGKTTAYVNNIRNVQSKGLRKSNPQSWSKQKKKASLIGNLVLYISKKPDLYRKVVAGSFALLLVGSFVGCKINPDAASKEPITIEQTMEQEVQEQKATIEYKIQFGDTLEGIVRSYTDLNVQSEINKICRNNGIDNPNYIREGQKIKIDVPESKLEQFGYSASYGEVNEWDAMEYFITEAFDVPASEVHPQNMVFWRDKKYVVGYLGNDAPEDIDLGNEKPILLKVAIAKDDLSVMLGDQYGFYSDQDIKNKEAEIYEYLSEGIRIAERNTGKKYGVDYILEAPIIPVPITQTLNK